MHWAGENGDIDLGLHVSSALWRWWLFSGRLAVGRDWLGKFLTTVGDRADEVTGRAYCAAAVLAAENGDYSEAVRQAELAMAIFDPLGLKTRMTLAATVIGSANRYLGNREGARRGFERAMELRAELGDRRGMSVAINNLALLELDDGNTDRAQRLFEQSLVIKREFGERRSIALGLANLADVLIRTGQWDAAETVLTEGAGLGRREPAADRDHRLQPGRAGRAPAGLGAGHREVRGGDRGVAGRRAPARRDRGDDRARPGARPGRRSAGRRRPAARRAGAGGRDRQPAAARGGGGCPRRDHPARCRHRRPAPSLSRPSLPENLTSRQAEVLALLAAGLSNKQIAAELYLSTATVERHLATIYRNLGLGGRVEAARFAMENGLAGQPRNRPLSGHLTRLCCRGTIVVMLGIGREKDEECSRSLAMIPPRSGTTGCRPGSAPGGWDGSTWRSRRPGGRSR